MVGRIRPVEEMTDDEKEYFKKNKYRGNKYRGECPVHGNINHRAIHYQTIYGMRRISAQ
ncbi:hypothetical protein LMG33818_001137 [Halomonadaceae bacterium LMG 33818]